MQMIAFTKWLASRLIFVSWDSVSSTMSASQSWAKAFSFDNVYPWTPLGLVTCVLMDFRSLLALDPYHLIPHQSSLIEFPSCIHRT